MPDISPNTSQLEAPLLRRHHSHHPDSMLVQGLTTRPVTPCAPDHRSCSSFLSRSERAHRHHRALVRVHVTDPPVLSSCSPPPCSLSFAFAFKSPTHPFSLVSSLPTCSFALSQQTLVKPPHVKLNHLLHYIIRYHNLMVHSVLLTEIYLSSEHARCAGTLRKISKVASPKVSKLWVSGKTESHFHCQYTCARLLNKLEAK